MLGTSYSTSARRTTATLLPRISRRWRPRFFSQRLPSLRTSPAPLPVLPCKSWTLRKSATFAWPLCSDTRSIRSVIRVRCSLERLSSASSSQRASSLSCLPRRVRFGRSLRRSSTLWICANTRRPCSLRSAPRLWSCLRPAPFLRLSSRSSSRACAALPSCACFSNLPRCSRR